MQRSRFYALLCFITGLTAVAYTTDNKPISGLNMKDFTKRDTDGNQWKTNPFLQRTDETSVNNLNLVAILYSEKEGGNNAAALVDGQIVRVGSKIGSAEVVSIQRENIVIRNETGLFKLSFKSKPK